MLFIFDMGGVVTNTFEIERLYEKLNLTSESFSMICGLKAPDIWHQLLMKEQTSYYLRSYSAP